MQKIVLSFNGDSEKKWVYGQLYITYLFDYLIQYKFVIYIWLVS